MSHEQFLTQVARLAPTLPDAPYLINLCEERYRFMLSLCAALLRGQTTLLPPNRLAATVSAIAAAYPGCRTIADGPIDAPGLAYDAIQEPEAPADPDADPAPPDSPELADRPDGIIVFTSGSTGQSLPHRKGWADQMLCSLRGAARFGIGSSTNILATVPPQHMYGLELSVLIPLATGATAHSERPFYPADIHRALAELPAPRVLVSTPVHLNACVRAGLEWPAIDFVISATAPLSQELARATEECLNTGVYEIYGCTEAGSVASRRTREGPTWRWYEGVRATADAEGVTLTADFLPGPIPLNDRFEILDAQHFRLLGRGSDMVNIGGKRASLADLNLKLNALPGVREGVILNPETEAANARLAAILVAPGLDRSTLLRQLRQQMDPVFIPRPILFVDALPRNEVGKIPRQWLLELLDSGTRGDP